MSDGETCPKCGSRQIRAGPYFNILGKLSDMRITEAVDKYYQHRGRYDDRTVLVFECGNKVVKDE